MILSIYYRLLCWYLTASIDLTLLNSCCRRNRDVRRDKKGGLEYCLTLFDVTRGKRKEKKCHYIFRFMSIEVCHSDCKN